MVARFTKDKYGWRCTDVWTAVTNRKSVISAPAINVLYVNVSRAPRLGFCRRPHFYL